MTFFDGSDKFETNSETVQMKVVSGDFVLFRLLLIGEQYVLMTATANENDGSYRAYSDLRKLTEEASKEFGRGEHKTDKFGRPYFETKYIRHHQVIQKSINKVCESLKLEACKTLWAKAEMLEIFENLSLGDGEKVYLSDGVYMDEDGNLSGI